ncbi:MAG: hypothetical protein IPO67_16580 [Deltaproteobacteria bacterium]|nr:hypothetical protein [Deltaproteobacteria bacterium]
MIAATPVLGEQASLKRLREFLPTPAPSRQYLTGLTVRRGRERRPARRLREALAARWDGDERLRRLPRKG